VSLLQNKILLSIYALNGSMNISLDQAQVEELIKALEQTQAKVKEVTA
jgi:hypothetical protein